MIVVRSRVPTLDESLREQEDSLLWLKRAPHLETRQLRGRAVVARQKARERIGGPLLDIHHPLEQHAALGASRGCGDRDEAGGYHHAPHRTARNATHRAE